MYLYLRSLKINVASSAVAAWTYSASGFFAARVLAGHLPILESYFALPLLLWLIENFSTKNGRGASMALRLAVLCVCVSGHPQIPAYSIAATILYVLARVDRALRMRALVLILQGVALSCFVWIPALLLIARSSRLLHLLPAANNVVFPYERLAAYFLPWRDGWPSLVARGPAAPFSAYPNLSYFWDTVVYVGWLPWAACAACIFYKWKRQLPGGPWAFVGSMGAISLALALPLSSALFGWAPWTFFHSPARLVYLTNFALVVFLGVFLDRIGAAARGRTLVMALIVAMVAAHIVDAGRHARAFLRVIAADPVAMPLTDRILASETGTARVAIESNLFIASNRRYDDVGFVDPLALALPYRNLMPSENGRFPNVEEFSGSSLPPSRLSELGVKFVVTPLKLDLTRRQTEKSVQLYAVPHPTPRVAFFETLNSTAPEMDLTSSLKRPSSDRMGVSFHAAQAGFVQFIESWDRGWSARVNGASAPVLKSNGFWMAVAVPAGDDTVELDFSTPGRRIGLGVSALALLWSLF
jgi:hypothetical protein